MSEKEMYAQWFAWVDATMGNVVIPAIGNIPQQSITASNWLIELQDKYNGEYLCDALFDQWVEQQGYEGVNSEHGYMYIKRSTTTLSPSSPLVTITLPREAMTDIREK